MVELNIINGCQRDGPCRQGNLDARGLKLHTQIRQAAKERIDLREDPSAVMDLVMEKVTESKPNFQCVHCGADVQVIVDSKAYMSLMDTVGDAMGGAPQSDEQTRGSSEIQPPAAGPGNQPAGENLEYDPGPAPIGGNEPLPGEAPPQEGATGGGISPPASGPDNAPSPPDPPEEQGSQSAGSGPDSGQDDDEDAGEGLPPHLRNFHIE